MSSSSGMQQRLASLLDPPIAFAHRGARAHAPENTLEAFSLALRLGTSGLESDVWLTADGVPVLDHDGVVRKGVRRIPLSKLHRDQLPGHIPSLADLYATCGVEFEFSLDVKSPEAYGPVAEIVRAQSSDLAARTWLCDPDLDRLASHREELADFKLVHSTRLAKLKLGPERHAAQLADLGIDVMNMHHTDWNGGLVVLFHRFGRLAFSWDLQFDHVLDDALRMGVDAVYSDHTDVMVDVLDGYTGRR